MKARTTRTIVSVLTLSLLVMLAGCAQAKNVSAEPPASVAAPLGDDRVERVPSGTPKQAVTSYLSAATDAYFSLETSMVAPFVTAEQEVREDAYIELNRQQSLAIEMKLTSFHVAASVEPLSGDATSTVVRTNETWRWRYWDIKSRKPSTEWAETSYEVEYSLARSDGGWLVASTKVLTQSGDATPTPLP